MPETSAGVVVCQKHSRSHFLQLIFWWGFVAKRFILQQASERTNRNLPARNLLVQLLALYTDPDSHNAQHYRQTDGRYWTT